MTSYESSKCKMEMAEKGGNYRKKRRSIMFRSKFSLQLVTRLPRKPAKNQGRLLILFACLLLSCSALLNSLIYLGLSTSVESVHISQRQQRKLNGVYQMHGTASRDSDRGENLRRRSKKNYPVIYYFDEEYRANQTKLAPKRYASVQSLDVGQSDAKIKNDESLVVELVEKYVRASEDNTEENNDRHREVLPTPFPEQDNCVPMAEWQMISLPTCNIVHETDLLSNIRSDPNDEDKLTGIVGRGSFRDAWRVKEMNGARYALKTLQFDEEFTANYLDWHRRDALVTERLTKSPYVVDIYSYCGMSGLFEYSSGGDLDDVIAPTRGGREMSRLERFWIAVQVALAVADLHNFYNEGQAAFAHTDVDMTQFVYVDGHFKLNDFNRGRFISWNEEKGEPCKFYMPYNPNRFRSPEEYNYEWLTEKIDIYQMGNIFYSLLTNKMPFEEIRDTRKVWTKVKAGERPVVPDYFMRSVDRVDVFLLGAMEMCLRQNPEERATAREVANFLVDRLQIIDREKKYAVIPQRPILPPQNKVAKTAED